MNKLEKLGVISSFNAVISAVLASICCIGPLVFVFLGLSGAAYFAKFEQYRWITTDDYDKKCHELKDKQFKNNEVIKNYLKADQNFKITVNTVLSISSKAYELFESSNIEQKRKLINFMFSNLELEGPTLRYSLKKPFDMMVDCTTYNDWLGIVDTLRTPDSYSSLTDITSLVEVFNNNPYLN